MYVQQIWILAWCVKRQNLAELCQQTFYFCSADSFSRSCFASCWIGAEIQIISWNWTSGDTPLRKIFEFFDPYIISKFVRTKLMVKFKESSLLYFLDTMVCQIRTCFLSCFMSKNFFPLKAKFLLFIGIGSSVQTGYIQRLLF